MEFSACHLLCLGWNPGTWSLSLPSPNNLTCPPIPCPSWAHSQVNQMLEFAFIDVAGNLHYKVMSYRLTHVEEAAWASLSFRLQAAASSIKLDTQTCL